MSDNESRAKYQCPEILEKYIDLANRVDPNLNLLSPREKFDINKKLFLNNEGNAWTSADGYLQTLKKTVEECLAPLPEEFRDEIIQYSRRVAWLQQKEGNEYSIFSYRESLIKYEEFYEVRKDLKDYANYFANMRNSGFISFGSGSSFGGDGLPVTLPPPRTEYKLEDSKEGWRTKIVPIGLSEALNDIIGDRVRSCEICNRIFWAQRKTSKTCSTSCFNKLKQRNARKRKKEAESKDA